MNPITTHQELVSAERELKNIGAEIADLENEINDLRRLEAETHDRISRYRKQAKSDKESLAKSLWEAVQSHWQRYTWNEHRIAERAASGEELVGEEMRRFRLLCAMELGVTA